MVYPLKYCNQLEYAKEQIDYYYVFILGSSGVSFKVLQSVGVRQGAD